MGYMQKMELRYWWEYGDEKTRINKEMNFDRLSHDRVTFVVDRDVSTEWLYRETNEQNLSPI